MARERHTGHCHICGTYGALTFEHIPPAKAFNNNPIVFKAMHELIESQHDPEVPIKGKQSQRGMGVPVQRLSDAQNR